MQSLIIRYSPLYTFILYSFIWNGQGNDKFAMGAKCRPRKQNKIEPTSHYISILMRLNQNYDSHENHNTEWTKLR